MGREEGGFRFDIGKEFCTARVVRWPRLPGAAVGAPSLSLGGLKARLDGAGGSRGWGGCPTAGGLELDGL